MKKLLIIASCGIIVALVIGATTEKYQSEQSATTKEHIFDAKCSEPREHEAERSPCAMRAMDTAHADMFL